MFSGQLDGDFMLTIGEFSRLGRVSAKTLRYYDRIGLLNPGYVSPESGYRYYEVSQLRDMLLISKLKQYQFSLPEIAAVMVKKDNGYLSAMIRAKMDEISTAFLAEVEKDDYAAYFKTVLFSGMRESEAIGLTWDCIDFENNTIRIEKQLQKRPLADGGYVFVPLKNNKTRAVQVAPFIKDTLKALYTRQAEMKLRAGDTWEGWQNAKERQTALVFTNEVGRHLIQNTVVAHFKKIVRSIGSPETRVHDLRHTFAVLSLQNGDDFKTVQENLGHATASFTLDVYGHVSAKMKQESANRMQNYICNIGS